MKTSESIKWIFFALVLVASQLFIAYDDPPKSLPPITGVQEAKPPVNMTGTPAIATAVKPIWEDSGNFNVRLAEALSRTAGVLAKNVGEGIKTYVQIKQAEKEQELILQKFYEVFYYYLEEYPLSYEQKVQIRNEVESIYIQESLKDSPEIDLTGFSDMKHIIKKVYADIERHHLREGDVETYYMTGELEAVWHYKNSKLEGPSVIYAKDGNIRFIDTYHKGFKINRKKYNADGQLEFSQDYPNPYNAAVTTENSASEGASEI